MSEISPERELYEAQATTEYLLLWLNSPSCDDVGVRDTAEFLMSQLRNDPPPKIAQHLAIVMYRSDRWLEARHYAANFLASNQCPICVAIVLEERCLMNEFDEAAEAYQELASSQISEHQSVQVAQAMLRFLLQTGRDEHAAALGAEVLEWIEPAAYTEEIVEGLMDALLRNGDLLSAARLSHSCADKLGTVAPQLLQILAIGLRQNLLNLVAARVCAGAESQEK